ncbi:hypothetical protein JI723_13875 [Providencia manganoxydans]|uniref:Apea-like HEPN domain-containing protein n=1 Tax=Providencia manganoxydans TaxID=2923283 RepID=A0ABX7ABX4_9GAMM|nr:hypothetical protein JI723_13875 [Providencia manganoxydans]
MFEVEYLFVFDEGSKTVATEQNIAQFIQNNRKLGFEGGVITFKGKTYKVKKETINGNSKNKVCVITLSSEMDKNLDNAREFYNVYVEFTDTLREIKKTKLVVLTNTVSQFLCKEAYEYINRAENKMRKLITLFMTTKIGAYWEKIYTPDDFGKSVKNERDLDADDLHNVLFYVNFSTLGDVLFDGYKTLDINELQRRLQSDKIDISEIKEGFVPRSNWDRFFEEIVGEESKNISKDWDLLYELRNKVAHNKNINIDDFNKIKGVSNRVVRVVDGAINKIRDVSVSTSDEPVRNLSQIIGDNSSQFAKIIYHRNFGEKINSMDTGEQTLFNKIINRVITEISNSIKSDECEFSPETPKEPEIEIKFVSPNNDQE